MSKFSTSQVLLAALLSSVIISSANAGLRDNDMGRKNESVESNGPDLGRPSESEHRIMKKAVANQAGDNTSSDEEVGDDNNRRRENKNGPRDNSNGPRDNSSRR